MALINVAIKFGDEYFCFGIYFSKIFFKKFFPKFFFQHFFPKFFFHIFFPNFFPKIFISKFFSQHFFLIFFFEGFDLDASPFTETKRTLCICLMKNMISKQSKLDFSLV